MSIQSPLKRVQEGSTLDITFTLSLIDDTIVEQTEEDELFRFTLGDGQFISQLEGILIGLEEGTKGKFVLYPEDAFGEKDPNNIQTMRLADFPEDMPLNEGHVIGFNSPTGDEIPGTVFKVEGDEVLIDFNHPLSGETLIFEAMIKEVIA